LFRQTASRSASVRCAVSSMTSRSGKRLDASSSSSSSVSAGAADGDDGALDGRQPPDSVDAPAPSAVTAGLDAGASSSGRT
jgi:hypothetical protein